MNLIDNQQYEKLDSLPHGEYANCSFKQCSFSEQDFSNYTFLECTFEHCDLSSVQVKNTALKDVTFLHCKLLGINFSEANPFLLSLHFEYSMLNYASFYWLNLKKIQIKKCLLEEVDFAEANLTGAKFIECDFRGALFDQTNLEKADLSTSTNYTLNPEANRIRKARFSREGAMGLLAKYDIIIE
jgi:fluoroquinolone resistance protein